MLEENIENRISNIPQNLRHFSTVLAQAPLILWAIDKNYICTLYEGRGLEPLGEKPGQRVGQDMRVVNASNPDSVQRMKRGLAGENFSWETESQGRWFSTNYTPIRDASGDVAGLIAVSIDVTEEKLARLALQENQEQLALALEAGKMGAWNWNVVTNELTWSPQLQRIFGLEPGCFRGTYEHYVELLHPEERDKISRWIQEAIEKKQSYEFEHRVIWPDGSVHWILGKGQPFFDESGRLVRMSGTSMDITEKRKTEVEYRQIFNLPTNLICIIGPDGCFHKANPAQKTLLGWDPDFLVGQPVANYVHPDDIERTANEITKLLQGAPVITDFRNRCLRRDGSYRWISGSGTAVENHIYAIGSDITDRIHIEAALAQSEEKFRNLAEAIPQMVWIADPQGKVTYYNRRWYDYTGITQKGLLEKGVSSLIYPSDLQTMLYRWSTVKENGRLYQQEYRIRRSDGVYRWFLARAVPFKDSNGKIIQWVGTATDIDDQKRAEASVKFLDEVSSILASSLDFKTTLKMVAEFVIGRLADSCFIELFSSSGESEALVVAHKDSSQVQIIKELRQKFPLPKKGQSVAMQVLMSGVGQIHTEVTDDQLRAASHNDEHYNLLKSVGVRSLITVPLMTKSKPFGVLSMTLSDGERRFTDAEFTLSLEMARRAALAIENSRLYSELKDKGHSLAEAVRARDEFISIASHELKTPLTSLLLQNQIAQRMYESGKKEALSPEKFKQILELSNRQVLQLARLVEDMLDVSRISLGRLHIGKSEFNLSELITKTVQELHSQLTLKGSMVTTEVEEAIVGTWDRFRIEQVIVNLLSNAGKYGDGKPIHVRARKDETKAVVSVQDQGIGIAPENHQRIFDRFERAVSASSISGLGLGLYISRHIVESHGGRIFVESDLGRGSTFTVELPL